MRSGEEMGAARTDHDRPPLLERDVDPDPIVQFDRWYAEAVAAGVRAPDSMTVATATPDGVPSARVVALRGYDRRGFVFYTHHHSAKARDLAENPRAALVWHWRELGRQVRVVGDVVRLDEAEAAAYFATRPLGSRIGAWASRQSEVLASREDLERAVAEAAARFGDAPPLPPFWGGYRVRPDELELWQGQASRLHDRLRYRRSGTGWVIERLWP